MDTEQYAEYLKNNLQPWAKYASGRREIYTRCKYCSDSKDRNKGHFYIKIPQSDKDLSYYYCQKCHTKGVVTTTKLMEWGVYNSEMYIDIQMHNNNAFKYVDSSKFTSNIHRLSNTFITDDNLSDIKLKYINKRLGLNLSYQDLLDNKIVLNLYDLLNTNRIYNYSRHKNIVDQLDESFLGFISYDNGFINMRNLNKGNVYHTIDKRYINYNIFDSYDNSKRYYISPVNIDLNTLTPIKINIAEGCFDILSVKYNLRKEFENNIYAAVCGSGYQGLCRDIILNLKVPNLEFHIYRDTDMSMSTIYNLKDYLYSLNYPIYVHSNSLEGNKDFGVSIENIRETIVRI